MYACVVGGAGVVGEADWVEDVHVGVPGLRGEEGGGVGAALGFGGVGCWVLVLGGGVEVVALGWEGFAEVEEHGGWLGGVRVVVQDGIFFIS